MGKKSRKRTREEEDEEIKGETMIMKIYKRIELEVKDPMFHVRMLTAVRGSIAVLVPTMLIYSDWCLAHFPTIAIVLCSHFLISHMVQSLTGVVAIAVQSFKGGIVGCFFGYLAYLAAPHLAVKLVYLFIFTIILGLWDPYLKQGIFVKWAIVDFFIILFTPQAFAPHSVLYGAGILYAVAHGFSFSVSIITSLLFWPNLSSFEFAREFKLSLQMCNEVFKLISFRIDRDVIKEGKKGHTQLGTTQELEAILHVHGLPDEDIKDFEHILSVKLIRLRRLMADSKAETWNSKIPDYEKLLDHMNNLYHQLKNIHSAMNSAKFSGLIHHTYLAPMLPFMESLQRNIIAHFESLLSPTPPPSPNAARVVRHEVVSKVLEVVDFDETVRTLDTAYRARVHDFESSETGNLPLPSREVTRLVYIIFGFVEFAHVLRDLEAIVARIGNDPRSRYGVIWEDVVFHFNLFPSANPITFVKEMIAKAKVMYNDFRQLTWRSAWNSPMWRFPIRLSFGLTGITLILFSIPSKHTRQDIFPYYTPLWACLTYVVVVLPSLGATVRKSVHRFGGTIVGAFMGHVFLLAVLAIHHHYGQAFVHIILQFLYFLPIIFLQQVPMFGYSSTVAGLTYLTIFIGQYRAQNGDILYACMRAFFILLGVTWAFIIGTFFFPSKSSIVYTKTLVDTISKIGSLFGDVIDRGMEMTPENEDNLKKEEEINSAIKTIHSNYLLMRSNLKEAKSELIFTWSGYKGFKDTLHQAHKAYYTLASMITILGHKGFSPELGELIGFMNSHFRHLVEPIKASAHRVEDVFHKRKLRTSECQSSAATILRTIDQQYYLFRKAKIEQRTLGDLHPAIRQFTTFLYLVREFVMEWRVMIETVNAFFNLNIEIFPVVFLDASSTTGDSTIVSPLSSPALSPSSIPHSTPEVHLLQVNGSETNCTRE